MASKISIHPSVDNGIKPTADNFAGGTLSCKCTENAVVVSIKGQSAQPCLWMHEVLEARWCVIFGGRSRSTGKFERHTKWEQT